MDGRQTGGARLALLWNVVTCAVIVGVLVFVAMRTASPIAFVLAAVAAIVLAVVVRRYRYARRMASAAAARVERR